MPSRALHAHLPDRPFEVLHVRLAQLVNALGFDQPGDAQETGLDIPGRASSSASTPSSRNSTRHFILRIYLFRHIAQAKSAWRAPPIGGSGSTRCASRAAQAASRLCR